MNSSPVDCELTAVVGAGKGMSGGVSCCFLCTCFSLRAWDEQVCGICSRAGLLLKVS